MEVVSERDQAPERRGGRIIGAFLWGQRLDFDAFPFPFERRKHADSGATVSQTLIVSSVLIVNVTQSFADRNSSIITSIKAELRGSSVRLFTNVSRA